MAEGGGFHNPVFHVQGDFHITTTSVAEGNTVIEKQHVGDQTRIQDCSIGTVNAGTSDQDISQKLDRQKKPDLLKTSVSTELDKATMLTETATLHISEMNYQAAMPLLVEAEARNFLRKILLAECYICTEADAKGVEIIDDVRRSLITPTSPPTTDDVKVLALDMIKNALYIRAMILFRIVSDMYKNSSSSPDDKLEGIASCLSKTGDVTNALLKKDDKSRNIATKYGLGYMQEILEDLRSVNDVDPKLWTLKEAGCLDWIGFSYEKAQKHELSLKHQQEAIGIMERYFDSSACEYKLYGRLLHNMGALYYIMGHKGEAEPYLHKAINVKEKALDYSSEKEKQGLIEWAKARLILVQAPGDGRSEFWRDYLPYYI